MSKQNLLKKSLSSASKWWKSLDQPASSQTLSPAELAGIPTSEDIHYDYIILRQAREMGRRQTSTDSNSSNQSENSISSSSSSQVRMRKTPSSTPRRPKSACPIQRAKTETASEPISSRNSPKTLPKTPVQIVQKSTPLSSEKRKFSRQKSVNKWSMKEIS
ncbi:Oidioi.mRNA.OKI2018_I69.chr2.g5428.t1.cds [Oikopleura dioica]|uniref:Oidioi.mRNA.OKI2018_I69.chr2.g5428.t1.cds n=1 Tax=Oikopleura dioica TaxID=34765 RepID=A0ABN7T4M1_OIKDI|nr:Oidioi.mRNA.OKI2018_I69.chr2.g5428.t1.cds [Oikopleura dioica]